MGVPNDEMGQNAANAAGWLTGKWPASWRSAQGGQGGRAP